MKGHRPVYKLCSGLVLFAFSWMVMANVNDVNTMKAEQYSRDVLFSLLPTSMASILTSLIAAFVYGTIVVCFVKGGYRILTFNQHLEEFED